MLLLLILAALSVIALLMLTVLHASILLSLLSLICALGGITLWVLRRKLPQIAVIGGGIVCAIAAAAVLIPAGNNADAISGYTTVLEDAENAIREGKYEQAQLLLEQAEDTYGIDDNTIYMSVTCKIALKDYAGAYEQVEQMMDHNSRLYYTMKEQIYLQDPSAESMEGLCRMYLAAAQAHPDWTDMQQNAGKAQIQVKNYESAIYFLERTLLQDGEDPMTYYYLGMANYYMSDYETSMHCFEAALEHGLGDNYKSDLLWYVEQMEQEG